MSLRLVAGALLVLPVFAGCLGNAGLDPAGNAPGMLVADLYASLTRERLDLPSFDGVPLNMWIYKPEAPEGTTFPIIVNFSPYWGNIERRAGDEGDAYSRFLIDTFVPKGYAVVLASVRGTGDSGGCFNYGGRAEIEDTVLTIEHLASLPWSNGKVAATGKSYDGTSPLYAAAANAPGLATIVPVSGATEWYKYTYNGGLPYGGIAGEHGLTFNTRYALTVGWGANMYSVFGLGAPITDGTAGDDACGDFAATTQHGVGSGLTGDYTEYYVERSYAKDVAEATASMLYIHGLQDFNVKPDMIPAWYNAYPGPKKALLGQWAHEYPARDDFEAILVAWMERWLKDVPNGVMDGKPVEVQADDGLWRYEADWPPTRATPLELHLRADGGLAPDGGEEGVAAFTQNPANDPQPDGGTSDFVFFQTEPLAAATRMAGAPTLVFNASSDRPVTAFTATLYDVAPNGTYREVNWAFLDARHRNGLDAGEPVPVGEAQGYTLAFFPQETVFLAGHRIGLLLSANKPTWVLAPPTGATNTVTVGPSATLALPVVEGDELLPVQPVMRPPGDYPWTGS